MSRSAFEAVKSESLPGYDANTSDEDEPMPSYRPTPEPAQKELQSTDKSKYISSNFSYSQNNVVFGSDHAIFGLKVNQNLIIRGQFRIQVQRGAIFVNNVIYHASETFMDFLNPSSNAIPLIQATQIVDRSKVKDTVTAENEHLFHSDFKSVIKVTDLSTGLEKVGFIAPVFKNIFWNSGSLTEFEISKLDDFERWFCQHTFSPVVQRTDSVNIINYKKWLPEVEQLTQQFRAQLQSLRVLIIGGKNSGKSTLLKLLLQNFMNEVTQDSDDYAPPVNIMDLDPGQAEFSKPDSISLHKVTTNLFGNHLSLTSAGDSINHYIGYTSPKDQPKRYGLLINDLIKKYNSDGLLKNETLLINTPGWINGYGLTLTKELIEKLRPTHLIYLNPGNKNLVMEQSLQDLNLDSSIEFLPVLGNYLNFSDGSVKYSAAQLRLFKILSYFHKVDDLHFDFSKQLLFKAPLQVSYGEIGIRAVSFLNVNGLALEDMSDTLVGTVCAIHTIGKKSMDLITVRKDDMSIPLIDAFELEKLRPTDLKFKSLALIHSVSSKEKLINIYIPEFEDLSKERDEEFVLIRGSTETPIWEVASRHIANQFGQDMPFVTFGRTSKFDKVARVRKVVARRGQA